LAITKARKVERTTQPAGPASTATKTAKLRAAQVCDAARRRGFPATKTTPAARPKTSHADETISQDAIHGCYPAAAGAALSRGGHPSQSTHTQSGKRPHQRSSEAYGKQECDECPEVEITDQDCGCGAIVTVR